MAATKQERARARRMWEEDGMSYRQISDSTGFSVTTLQNWRKKDGWGEKGSLQPEVTWEEELATLTESSPADVTFTPPPAHAIAAGDDKDAEIARLRAELERAEARLEELSPVVAIGVYTTPEEVVQVLGRDMLEEIALARFGLENIQRIQRGMPSTNWEGTDRLEREIERIANELLAKRTKFVGGGANVRVVKMVKPDGSVIQVPVEQQVSNESAEPGTAIMRAKAKGYKLTDPYLCQVINCWNVAVTGTDGRPVDGYCSATLPDGTPHRALDPYLNKRRMDGVSGSQPIHATVGV